MYSHKYYADYFLQPASFVLIIFLLGGGRGQKEKKYIPKGVSVLSVALQVHRPFHVRRTITVILHRPHSHISAVHGSPH